MPGFLLHSETIRQEGSSVFLWCPRLAIKLTAARWSPSESYGQEEEAQGREEQQPRVGQGRIYIAISLKPRAQAVGGQG